MNTPAFRFIGRGVYSLQEAHRLTRIPTKRIRRWTVGYEWDSRGRRTWSPPVIQTDAPAIVGVTALDFADLLEVRFLNAFREHGVSWHTIRIAAERARQVLGISHPFSNRRFSTDGRTILATYVVPETGDEALLDLVRDQYELNKLISQFLFGEIEFGEHDAPAKWWPVSGSRRIVIDPRRMFGTPILDEYGIPTRVLASAVQAEDSIEIVSELYEVDPIAVAEAVEYEASLAVQ